MTKYYNSYGEAERHRQSDEMTIFDVFIGKYKNVKVFQPFPQWRKNKW